VGEKENKKQIKTRLLGNFETVIVPYEVEAFAHTVKETTAAVYVKIDESIGRTRVIRLSRVSGIAICRDFKRILSRRFKKNLISYFE